MPALPKTATKRKMRKHKNKKKVISELFVLHANAITFWSSKIYTNEPYNQELGKITFHHCKNFDNLTSHEKSYSKKAAKVKNNTEYLEDKLFKMLQSSTLEIDIEYSALSKHFC